MGSKIAINQPGSYLLLNGDEAVARGALEAGIKVATAYPGTPSTEILEAIAEVAKTFGVYAEWSTNEIVAMEVAAGAAMAGVRAMVSMKHVGLNVAADAAMTLAYTGTQGGLLIVVCDDPSLHSSQNEQDTRYFAMHSDLPLLDAGSPQEAYKMAKEAFEISEQLKLPIILRLTTRVAHVRSRVQIGEFEQLDRKADFDKDSSRWAMIPGNAYRKHFTLKTQITKSEELANQSKFNILEDNNQEIGIIGSGIGYYYAKDLLDEKLFSWLKLGFVYPFPNDLVKKFASKVKKIVVIEELKPYIENNLQCLDVEVLGKSKTGLSEIGEFTPDVLRVAFSKLGFCEAKEHQSTLELPPRAPTFCPGCTHRALYYALNSVKQYENNIDSLKNGQLLSKIVAGDIGCYTLGCLPPLSTIHTCLCMGAGISQAAGMYHAGVKDKLFAVIGDSTFFHAGMPGLLNIVYNKANVCVIILDNRTTAMTGHQPTPESGITVMGEQTKAANIETIVRALGIDQLRIVDPYDIKQTTQAIKDAVNYQGPSVIITQRACPLKAGRTAPYEVTDNCKICGYCIKSLGCPAMSLTATKAQIEPTLCQGCGVCAQICKFNAIRRSM
ncbi:MAG: indolepyruvate ferredoxin oxidoreductase subunit alpha [Crenarchaeota archaeon]|nr:indolepyruvate ferredoxin oxidoreductase subunit alpha [Thermoproteota archaeon]